jgi:transcriptional regulator with XRE-family HTH domain
LTDTKLSGFPTEHCAAVIDPEAPDDMLAPLQKAAHMADDVLLLYFSGHGLLMGKRHDLHLALTGTEDDRFWTSVPFLHVEDIVLGSPASAKIIILDCCYSGRALGSMTSDPITVAVEQLAIEGLYVITSCSGTKTSLAPDKDEFTAFTGCMLDVMRTGVPHPDEYLPMKVVYEYVTKRMASTGLRKPQQQARNTAGALALVRNVYRPASDGLPPDQTPPDEQPIRLRISRWREHRRFSRLAFAQLLGRSESWVRRVENGRLRLDKLSVLRQISDVLSIDLQTLLGKEPTRRTGGYYSIDVVDTDEIRSAMEKHYVSAGLWVPATEPAKTDELRASIEVAWRHLDDAHYAVLGRELPGLLTGALTLNPESRAVAAVVEDLFSQIYQIGSSMLRKVGEHELSWLAADRAASAALQSGDSLLLGAAISRTSGALLSLGRVRSALELSLGHADAIGLPKDDTPESLDKAAIYGTLLLEGALAAARIGDSPSVHDLLNEAHRAAQILGRDETHYRTQFGPTSVEIFRAAAAVELGDGRTALQINETVGPGIDQLTPAAQGNHFLAMTRASLQSADLNRGDQYVV